MRPPDPDSISSLEQHGKSMRGKTIGQILHELEIRIDESNIESGKGGVGNAIQAAFGLGLDSRSEADFPDASGPGIEVPGLELKIVPLKKGSGKWRVKERQVIGMINYNQLPREVWPSSHARTKMNRILNVFVTHEPKGEREKCIVKGASIWEPDSFIDPILEEDWSLCQSMVSEGSAHRLSERFFKTLSAARKGSGGKRDLVAYHHGSEPAMRRAFSLKVAYMNGIWECYTNRIGSLRIFEEDDPLEACRSKLEKIEGRTTAEVMAELSLPFPRSKDYAYRIVRQWLTGGKGGRRIAELDDIGIILKTVPINPSTQRPWEATSFPAIDIAELTETKTFEDHFMSEEVSAILFVPTIRESRKVPWTEVRFGKPVLWQPSDSEWRIMEEEWRMHRDILRIENGANEIPKAKETRIFHLRPKAKNNTVRDIGPWGDITRQCFWLNQDFVQSILNRKRSMSRI
ncbi:MAG: MutH/Sau3AI family endonuclease [Candidatus Thalassarchaeaceae archaeon]